MQTSTSQTLAWLGYGGLLPFGAGTVAVVMHQGDWALPALVAYGACILSFLGAVHWGWVLGPEGVAAKPGLPVVRTLLLGVVPSLVAWVALLLPVDQGLALLIAGLGSWYRYEQRVLGVAVLGTTYLALRQQLTFGAVGCLVVALVTR
jgi:hypothetical protein